MTEYPRKSNRLDERQAAAVRLETNLLEGLASGPARQITPEDWAKIRIDLFERAGKPDIR